MKSFITKTVLSLLFFAFYGCGNSALHWIQDGDKIIVPDSKKTVSQKLQIENISSPSQLKPIVSFQVSQLDKVSSSYYYKLKEVKKEWTYSAGLNATVWTLGWILAEPLWFYFIEWNHKKWNNEEIQISPTSTNGSKMGYFLRKFEQSDKVNITWSPTGKVKDSEIRSETVDDKKPLRNTTVGIKINNLERTFPTDYFGGVKVDLIKYFNLIRSENDNLIDVFVSDKNDKLSTTLNIKPSDWMEEYLKVNSKDIEVIGESGNRTVTLGRLKPGEEYRLVHKGSQLWKIDYNGKEGYVPLNSGEIYWAAKKY